MVSPTVVPKVKRENYRKIVSKSNSPETLTNSDIEKGLSKFKDPWRPMDANFISKFGAIEENFAMGVRVFRPKKVFNAQSSRSNLAQAGKENVRPPTMRSNQGTGKGVTVSPVLKQGATSVDAYFPAGNWFNLFNYSNYVSVDQGKIVKLDAPFDHINVNVREGSILARKTHFHLLVVLSMFENSTGEVFLDEGESLDMGIDGGNWTLVSFNGQIVGNVAICETRVVNGEYASSQELTIEMITFLGLKGFKKMDGHELSGSLYGDSVVTTKFEDGGEFGIVDVSGLLLLIGKGFNIKLNFGV